MSGQWCAGTTFLTFEDVKVPVENLIGTENEGFKMIMTNVRPLLLSFVLTNSSTLSSIPVQPREAHDRAPSPPAALPRS